MGTRAAFWTGDPQDMSGSRKWLGCIAWDGYPSDEAFTELANAIDEKDFRELVIKLFRSRDDFTDPRLHGWPFPWDDDIFLTDYTYAWFNNEVQVTCFHSGWLPLRAVIQKKVDWKEEDLLPSNVPAPARWDPTGKDSIIIISVTDI